MDPGQDDALQASTFPLPPPFYKLYAEGPDAGPPPPPPLEGTFQVFDRMMNTVRRAYLRSWRLGWPEDAPGQKMAHGAAACPRQRLYSHCTFACMCTPAWLLGLHTRQLHRGSSGMASKHVVAAGIWQAMGTALCLATGQSTCLSLPPHLFTQAEPLVSTTPNAMIERRPDGSIGGWACRSMGMGRLEVNRRAQGT